MSKCAKCGREGATYAVETIEELELARMGIETKRFCLKCKSEFLAYLGLAGYKVYLHEKDCIFTQYWSAINWIRQKTGRLEHELLTRIRFRPMPMNLPRQGEVEIPVRIERTVH